MSILTDVSPVIWVSIAIATFLFFHFLYNLGASVEHPHRGFPLITLGEDRSKPGQEWYERAKEIIAKGLRSTKGPFQVSTGVEPLVSSCEML